MNGDKQNYQAWGISSSAFPFEKSIEEQIHFLVGYANLAPSVHNTQPWQFAVLQNQLTITPDASYPLPIADPLNRGLYIALGACAENFCAAARAYGFTASVQVLNDRIIIKISGVPTQTPDVQLLRSITDRHSNKTAYKKAPLSPEVTQSLQSITEEGAQLRLLTSEPDLEFITELHMQAAKKVVADNRFVEELFSWLRTNDTTAGDGMPGFVAGNSNLKTKAGLFLFRKKPQLFAKAALKDKDLLVSSSAVAIFSTLDNTAVGWAKTGMLIERVWLEASKHGLVGHPLSPSVHDPETVGRMTQHFELQGTPVFLMRMGNPIHTDNRTPRRDPKWNSQ